MILLNCIYNYDGWIIENLNFEKAIFIKIVPYIPKIKLKSNKVHFNNNIK